MEELSIVDGIKVIRCGQVTSAMDLAFDLSGQERLGIFDSVLAASQSSGRGQMRRAWNSPPGNIYAAQCLPDEPPFNSGAAAAAVATGFAIALNLLGFSIKIKWPNDLILFQSAEALKVGGILLEQRGAMIVAGVGINLAFAPKAAELREGGMPAGRLWQADERGPGEPDAESLWVYLVRESQKWYTLCRKNHNFWLRHADDLLLWKGRQVRFCDDDENFNATLLGFAPSGGVILKTPGGELEFTSGALSGR